MAGCLRHILSAVLACCLCAAPALAAPNVTGATVGFIGQLGTQAPGLDIAAAPGVRFGMELTPEGSPKGAPVVLEASLKRPRDASADPPLRWLMAARLGYPVHGAWEFAYDWEVEPGEWTMTISHDGRELARASFAVLPAGGASAAQTSPGTALVPGAASQSQDKGRAGQAADKPGGRTVHGQPSASAPQAPAKPAVPSRGGKGSDQAQSVSPGQGAKGAGPGEVPTTKGQEGADQAKSGVPGQTGGTNEPAKATSGPLTASDPTRATSDPTRAASDPAKAASDPAKAASDPAKAASGLGKAESPPTAGTPGQDKTVPGPAKTGSAPAKGPAPSAGASGQAGATGSQPGKVPAGQPKAAVRPVGGAPDRRVYALIGGTYSEEARALWVAEFLKKRGVSACVRREERGGRRLWQLVAGWRDTLAEAGRARQELAPVVGDVVAVPTTAAELEKGLSCR